MGEIFSGQKIGKEELEMVEELLYSADLGPKIVADLISNLEKTLPEKNMNFDELKKFLFDYMFSKLSPVQEKLSKELKEEKPSKVPTSIMIVGVNGAGKTTTIGKLATQYAKNGNSIYVGACDTFRAAAVDQLQVWCERANVPMIRAKEGADPSGVAYETLQKSINEKANYCLLDTAGRLHTKANLMEELKKSKRVLSKLDETAPNEVFLVLDAVTGQNALRQAQEFNNSLGITALIFTKCDGSAKAGSAVGIMDELQVPIAYIGVGETVEDLRPFNLVEYLEALLDYKSGL